jgi:hypothetical protein
LAADRLSVFSDRASFSEFIFSIRDFSSLNKVSTFC